MNILTWYLGKTITQTILMAVVLLLGLELFFSLVNELRIVGTGDYTMINALFGLLLSVPQKIYRMFPLSALLGTLMGLGVLAGHSELVVMRAQGLSILNIVWIIAKIALFLAVITWGLGEIIAPVLENKAQHQKALAISGGQAIETKQGTWMRDGADFVHIRSVQMDGRLEGVTRYQFNDQLQAQKISYAAYGRYQDHHWILSNIEETEFGNQVVHKHFYPQQTWNSELSPSILNVIGQKHLEKLSLLGLWKTIQYREVNHLDANVVKLIFWGKVLQPLATMIMMILACPFIFGPLRRATMGLRLLTGILVGFSFYMFNHIFGHAVIAYGFPPLLGASLPLLVFLTLGIVSIRRTA